MSDQHQLPTTTNPFIAIMRTICRACSFLEEAAASAETLARSTNKACTIIEKKADAMVKEHDEILLNMDRIIKNKAAAKVKAKLQEWPDITDA